MKAPITLLLTALAASAFAADLPATITVPVLKNSMQKGQTITAADITQTELPANAVFASTLTSENELVGQEAVRPLMAGTPINKLHVRVPPLIAKNDLISIRFRQGAVELVVKGQALEDGQLGQTIKVVNPTTRATLAGVVREGATVDIN